MASWAVAVEPETVRPNPGCQALPRCVSDFLAHGTVSGPFCPNGSTFMNSDVLPIAEMIKPAFEFLEPLCYNRSVMLNTSPEWGIERVHVLHAQATTGRVSARALALRIAVINAPCASRPVSRHWVIRRTLNGQTCNAL